MSGFDQFKIIRIVDACAALHGLKPIDLKRATNRIEVVRPRQIAMYLSRELTGASLTRIARAFGGKHHTTVKHSLMKIAKLVETDGDVRAAVELIRQQLGGSVALSPRKKTITPDWEDWGTLP